MADNPNPPKERFTMLESVRANNPSPEELATRVVDLAFEKERFTMLEPVRANNPSPEELATRVVEPLINCGPVTDGPSPVPPAVRTILAQLVGAVGALDPGARRAAVDYAVRELNKRRAS